MTPQQIIVRPVVTEKSTDLQGRKNHYGSRSTRGTEVAALLFPNPAEPVRPDAVRAALARHNAAHPGSSTRIARALLVAEPPSIDRGEITDKGYINQRAVLDCRADLVERLFAGSPDPAVLVIDPNPRPNP